MKRLIIAILSAMSLNCYSQLDSMKHYEIIDSSINILINYNDIWRELKTIKSISTSSFQNKYSPVIHIESNPNYQSELDSSPDVVTALLVVKDSNIDTTIIHNEDEYLNQIKLEMLQHYRHLQFEDEIQSTKIQGKELRSIKASVNIMGYFFYQEYITFFFDQKYVTILLIYNNEEKRSELLSIIYFIDEH